MPKRSSQLAPLPRRRAPLRRFAVALCLATAALAARADIAVLREKGPHSGSAFSNPGLVADAPAGLKVAMKTADVKIHLRPGDGDTLKADCTAEFEMEDWSPVDLKGQSYLVGFPVTGLGSKVVTIDRFSVIIDGKEPPTVLRRNIYINRREAKRVDQKLSGELEARFAPENEQSWWTLHYSKEDMYPASFLWQQTVQPWAQVHVRVAYTVTLRPQSIHYSKSYAYEDGDGEVIPLKNLSGDRWNDRFYFFDYVLRSGATWDSVIGREVIEITSDPKLGLAADSAILQSRKHPTAFVDDGTELPERESPPSGVQGKVSQSSDKRNGSIRWMLENGDPAEDLLIAIPLSAFKR